MQLGAWHKNQGEDFMAEQFEVLCPAGPRRNKGLCTYRLKLVEHKLHLMEQKLTEIVQIKARNKSIM
jgi:hypothetical protein